MLKSDPLSVKSVLSGFEGLQFGGWLSSRTLFDKKRKRLIRGLQSLHFKRSQEDNFPLVVTLQGGTGTGKSSVFNALIGKSISLTGVERPQTRGCIFFVPSHAVPVILESEPFLSFPFGRIAFDDLRSPVKGEPGGITIVEHTVREWENILLIDSPDLDSVEEGNRTLAEEIMLLSDLILFVTSQEKYADNTPFEAIKEVSHDRKPFLLIINKLDSQDGLEDLHAKLDEFGLKPYRDIIGFSRVHHDSPLVLRGKRIEPLRAILMKLNGREVLLDSNAALYRTCHRIFSSLYDEVMEEEVLNLHLVKSFQGMVNEARKKLEGKLSTSLDKQTEREIRGHVRRLLKKYDFFHRPRRLIRRAFRMPAMLFGLVSKHNGKEQKVNGRFTPARGNVEPLLQTCAWLQQAVARFMGEDESLSVMYSRMAQQKLFLTSDEVNDRYHKVQIEIDKWLEERFQKLKKGLTRQKEVGLYSASLLTGIMLLAVESVTFGGVTFFELILDTAIMPLIPRGVLEVFVYDELKEIGRELDNRHRKAMFGIVDEQYARLESFVTANVAGVNEKDFVERVDRWFQDRV